MRTLFFCVTVDDVYLDNYSTPEHLEKLLRFWNDEGLKGTIFVVPRSNGKEIGEEQAYVDILKDAIENGHEVALHGLDHERFQTGIPPKIILDLPHEGPARKYLAENREKIEASHTIENLRETLSLGRDILESALPVKIQGFRAPACSICDNLFIALEQEGFTYDSSHIMQTSAWNMISDPGKSVEPQPIDRAGFDAFQMCRKMRELPIMAEYTWYLKREHYDMFLKLAKHDIDACISKGLPYIPICHVSPIEQGDPECGFDFYRELIAYARTEADKHGVSMVGTTMSNLLQQDEKLF